MTETAVAAVPAQAPPSLIAKMAQRFSVEPNKMLGTLKQTAFRTRQGEPEVTNEQMMALLIVADQYKLNPFTKELYAFPDKNAGIVPVVGVDGWARIINEHAHFDGMEFVDGDGDPPAWIECVVYRKDRSRPTRVREYLAECKRATQPWQSHPRRMLRHKAMIQCARLAFGFVGIFDEDEAQRITSNAIDVTPIDPTKSGALASINATVAPAKTAETIDVTPTTTETPAATPTTADGDPITFAQVAGDLAKAKTKEGVDLARDLIRHVADEKQRAELEALATERLATIENGVETAALESGKPRPRR
jgi:phage recombination protein Bet